MADNLKKYSLFSVYLLGFLFSLQVALPSYINSSYLGTLMSENFLGLVYIIEAILAIGGFLLMPKILRKFGNFKVAIVLSLIEMASLLGLIFYYNVIAVSFFMIGSLVTITFLYFSLDVFLEGFSVDASTGKVRGIYMTCMNSAWVLAPVVAGFILVSGDYWKVYFAAFLLLIPVFLILQATLVNFKDSKYQFSYPFRAVTQRLKDKDIFNIFMANLLLKIFYSWMIIYTPIYLHTNLGLGWDSVGIIFGIMLLPFIFVQFPAGRLADSRYGEKEMLSIGFVIMALATIVMYFVVGKSVLVWSLILFGTRIGAAVVEIMCDVYFFKKVDYQDTNLISFYRMTTPLSYIIGPLLATLVLCIPGYEIKNLFLILGFMMFFGLKFSLSIHDTK